MRFLSSFPIFFILLFSGCSHSPHRSLASEDDISYRDKEIYEAAYQEIAEALEGKRGPTADLDARQICRNLASQGSRAQERAMRKFVKDPDLFVKRHARRNACDEHSPNNGWNF